MKTLPTNIATEVVKQITTPFYLIELGWDTVGRYSTRQACSYDGNNFSTNFAHVTKISDKATTLILNNETDAGAALALNENVKDRYIKIWAAYGIGTTLTDDDVTLVFEGVMLNVSGITPTAVTIKCSAVSEGYLMSPRIYCGPPIHSYLIPVGAVIGDYKLSGDRSESFTDNVRRKR